MTSFESIAGAQSVAFSNVLSDGPSKPRLLHTDEPSSATVKRQNVPANLPDLDSIVDIALSRFGKAADQNRALVEMHPHSMTARARLADAEFSAGNRDEAILEAVEVLDVAASRNASGGPPVDLPAAYLAAQILARVGKYQIIASKLSGLDSIPFLAHLRATALAETGNFDEALSVLEDLSVSDNADVESLKGYIFLSLNRHAEALRHLRRAQRMLLYDADVTRNMSLAFWGLGSTAKAVRSARAASRMAPGRRDLSVHLLHLLIEVKAFEDADAELRSLSERRLVQDAEVTLIRAKVTGALGNKRRALALLKQARTLAANEPGRETLHNEIEGNLTLVEYHEGSVDRAEALMKIRAAIRRSPTSVYLISLLAALIDRTSAAAEVRSHFESLPTDSDEEAILGLKCRLFYLEQRFEEAAREAAEASRKYEHNEYLLRGAVIWYGLLTQDWSAAATWALKAVKVADEPRASINSAAYALALAGRGEQGLGLIKSIAIDEDYVLIATRGLCYLSMGNLTEGLRSYRDAAKIADKDRRSKYARSLMTIHQAMGVRRLNLEHQRTQLLAAALPSVELPAGWSDIPEFQLLREAATRAGWAWPVVIE